MRLRFNIGNFNCSPVKRLLFFMAVALCLYGFTVNDEDPWVKKVVDNMIVRATMAPQEKVYLHMDRDHYDAGDRIWFRAYLVDAMTHIPSAYSRFVYVELTNRQDSVLQRVKIGYIDSVFTGYVNIPQELPQGEYFVRAYTYWMQNLGEDFLFKKKIMITNPEDSKVLADIVYTDRKNGYAAKIRFTNFDGEPYKNIFIDYQLKGKGKKERFRLQRTDKNGEIEVKFDSLSIPNGVFVRFGPEAPFEFERYLKIIKPVTNFDVCFFPEGGDLLTGNLQNIAFKAVGNDGLAIEVEGNVYSETGKLMAIMRSTHKGMGGFTLTAEPGEKYYAVVNTTDSLKKRIDLPGVKRNGIALKATVRDTLLLYNVLRGDSTIPPGNLYLLVSSRGKPEVVLPLDKGKMSGKIILSSFPEGILQLVLMDQDYRVYSQRLCFVRKSKRADMEIIPDKRSYVSREKIKLNLGLSSDPEWNCEGSFSIAVTDDGKMQADSSAGNILSNLLLTSDLKGYIEDPDYYFRNISLTVNRNLDLLLMTQGWTRFDISEIAGGKYGRMPYFLERGQALAGKVKSFRGKDVLGAELVIIGTNGAFQMLNADSSGHFIADGITFSDGTKFVVQARSPKGRRNVEVSVDEDEYLPPRNNEPYGKQTLKTEDQFYKKFVKNFYYENGVKVYVLDELLVTRRKPRQSFSMYDDVADYRLDSAKIASMAKLGLRWILQELPGVMLEGDKVTRYGKTLHLVIDDFPENFDYLDRLFPEDIISISLLDDMRGRIFFGQEVQDGALVITTKPGFTPHEKPRYNMATISPLGYQKPVEFYVPKYEVDSIRTALTDTADMRTTIYWNPDVRTDESGKAEVSFFTADAYGTYTVTLEGITTDGILCRKQKKITLKLPY